MFVSNRRFEARMADMERQYFALNERYWKLRQAHDRLLAHIGLSEVEVPFSVMLVKRPADKREETAVDVKIVEKHEPREYSAISHDGGTVLCDKKTGAFLVLRFQEDVIRLRQLLDSIEVKPPSVD